MSERPETNNPAQAAVAAAAKAAAEAAEAAAEAVEAAAEAVEAAEETIRESANTTTESATNMTGKGETPDREYGSSHERSESDDASGSGSDTHHGGYG